MKLTRLRITSGSQKVLEFFYCKNRIWCKLCTTSDGFLRE